MGASDFLRARGRSLLALVCFGLAALSPTVARADGGPKALAAFLLVLLTTIAGLAAGLGTFITALRSPSRARLAVAFAITTAAMNGVMGMIMLALLREGSELVVFLPSLQVALAVIGIPTLLIWKRATGPAGAGGEPPLSRRWLVSWVLGYVAVAVVANTVLLPLYWGVQADDQANRASALNIFLIPNGVVRGVLLGFVQWLLLRRTLKIGALWFGLTAVASAAALYVGSLTELPTLAMLARGTLVGAAQWPLLRTRLHASWRWVLLSVLLSLLDWPRGAVYVYLPWLTWVLGWGMTVLEALATGFALSRLAREKLRPSAAN